MTRVRQTIKTHPNHNFKHIHTNFNANSYHTNKKFGQKIITFYKLTLSCQVFWITSDSISHFWAKHSCLSFGDQAGNGDFWANFFWNVDTFLHRFKAWHQRRDVPAFVLWGQVTFLQWDRRCSLQTTVGKNIFIYKQPMNFFWDITFLKFELGGYDKMENFFGNNPQADYWNNPQQLLKLYVINIKLCWPVCIKARQYVIDLIGCATVLPSVD